MKLVPLKSLRLHPELNRVPRMPPEQSAEFQADIAERGILSHRDHRRACHRRWQESLLAAKRLGIQRAPVTRAPLNGDDPIIDMLRAATKRRHLTDDQRA